MSIPSANKASLDRLFIAALEHHKNNRLEEAQAIFQDILQKDPNNWDAMNLLGQVYRAQKALSQAVDITTQAIAIKPDVPELFVNLGVIMQDLNQFAGAIECHDQALSLRPNYAHAWANKAVAQKSLLQLEQAVKSLERAIELNPNESAYHTNLGNTYTDLGQFSLALLSHERALALAPNETDYLWNKCRTLSMAQQYAQALECAETALALKPGIPDFLWSRAQNLLMLGDFEQGWRLFEWRWKAPQSNLKAKNLRSPLWLGKESMQGKRILLHGEQGLGDSLQFCRFVPWVVSLGAQVVLMVPKPLQRLFKDMAWGCEVITPDRLVDDFDFQCPLMSLPLAYGFDLDHIPEPYPYLAANPTLCAAWSQRLGPKDKLRVGLVWSGGVHLGEWTIAAVNQRRNVSLRQLAPLAHANVAFFSLQKGEAAEQELQQLEGCAWAQHPIQNWSDELTDFAETAALIDQLDLVIGVDTSTVHLSAAMGKPTWLLNRFDSCWRWLTERSDSPWYPSMTIYRQQSFRDWGPVIETVTADLASLTTNPSSL